MADDDVQETTPSRGARKRKEAYTTYAPPNAERVCASPVADAASGAGVPPANRRVGADAGETHDRRCASGD
jgi:hypothetical protein